MLIKAGELYENFRKMLEKAPGRELEARELACFCLGIDKSTFFLKREREFEVLRDPQVVISRRIENGEPLAYILGEWDFFGRTFSVLPGVLVPRTDSEFVLERALDAYLYSDCSNYSCHDCDKVRQSGCKSGENGCKAQLSGKKLRQSGCKMTTGARILDLCCGSGVLGVTFALELEKRGLTSEVIFGDISETALDCAGENVLRHGLKRAEVLRLDATEPAEEDLGRFDVILCNPPYVRSGDIAGLDREVRDFEPRLALDGGGDGLRFYRAVTRGYFSALWGGGLLVFEVGAGQGAEVAGIMERAGFRDVRFEKDYEGNDRAAIGRR